MANIYFFKKQNKKLDDSSWFICNILWSKLNNFNCQRMFYIEWGKQRMLKYLNNILKHINYIPKLVDKKHN